MSTVYQKLVSKLKGTLGALVFVLFLTSPLFSHASAPQTIPFGAILTTASGNSVVDGTYSVVFRLYSTLTGGSPVWSETQSVKVTQGELAVDLGSSSSLVGVDFNNQLYLSFQVESDPEMTPRYALDSVPYALNAAKLNGKDASTFVQSDTATTFSAPGTGLTVTNDAAVNGNLNLGGTLNGINIASGVITNASWHGTDVGVQYGGTGASSFTSNGILYGNGSGALQVTAGGASGQLLVANASGVPTFVSVSGDASLTSSGALTLATVNSSPGTYGSGNQIPQISVDAKGRITGITNVVLSGLPPGGAAGGDLGGDFPLPTVAKINGVSLGTTTATSGNLLIADGTKWATQALTGDASITSAGVLTVSSGSITGTKITSNTITAANLTSGDYSTKVTSGTYSINISGNSATVTNGVYTNGANVLTSPANNSVPLAVHPASGSATADILDIYGKSGSLVSYFDVNGVFNGPIGSLSNIPNSALTNSSVTVNTGSGLSGGGSVALGGSLTISNTGVTSITGTSNQVIASGSTGAVTLSLPQNINSGATPTFAGATLNGAGTALSVTHDASVGGDLSVTGGLNGLSVATGIISAGEWRGTPVGVSYGGTGGTTQATARSGIGAAASGSNSDITALSGLTTALSVAQGGTGAGSFTSNGVLFGNGTGALQVTAGTSGQMLVANSSGVPTFVTLSSDASLAANGALTLATVNSNVGTFGSSSQVPQLTVNGKGLITGVTNVTISGTVPGGSASGDLSGSYPSPVVAKINTVPLGSTTATAGNLLIGSGTDWVSQVVSGDASLGSTGTVTIGAGVVTGGKIAGNTITATNLTSGDYSSKITSGTYSINVSGNSATVSNGVYTNANNVVIASSDASVPLTIKPVTTTGTGNVLDIYGIGGSLASYFDKNGLFNGSGAGISSASIANSALANNSLTVTAGTGLSGGGSVALGSSVTINNAGVTSLTGTSNQVAVSASTGGITISLPQNINTGATPTFAGATLNGAGTSLSVTHDASVGGNLAVSGTVNGLNVASGVISAGEWRGTPVEVSYGGTGGTTQATARSGIGAAASGSNSDITALSGLTTALSVAQGGTGIGSATSNGLVFGNGTGALQVTAAGTSGQLLVANGSGIPTFVTLSSDATLAATGAVTLATVNSNVGTFGSNNQVPQLTVNGKGLITGVSNVTISGTTPGGSATGDLSGSYPNPVVAQINTVPLGSTTATAGNLLIGSGTDWVSQVVSGDASLGSTGTITLGNSVVTGAKIANNTIGATKLTSGDYSSKITSGTYSVSISGNANTVSNGVYTNAANVIVAPSDSAVSLSLKPVASTGTGDVLDIYNNAATPAIASYFDLNGLFNGSGAGITSGTIANSSLAHNSVTVTAGTGLSGGGSVALGSSVTINNTGVTSLTGTSNQVSVSASTGGITISLPQNINSGATPTFAGANITGTASAGTLTDGTASLTAGALTGGTTAVFATSLTSGTHYGGTTVGGNLSLQSTSNATKGNVYFNGVTAYVDSAGNLFGAGLNVGTGTVSSGDINGQTISSSANFTGTVTAANTLTVSSGGAAITGDTTLTGNLLPSGSRAVGASGNRFNNGYFSNLDVTTLTSAGGSFTAPVTIGSASSPQLTVKYDNSNYYTTEVASNGAVTFDAVGAGAAFNFADGVTANVFNSSGVVITGGSVDGTTIGGTTRAAGSFTTLAANNGLTVSAGGATIAGTTNINTSGTSATTIGNTGAALSIASTALNVSSAGAISGVTTIAASNAVTLSGSGANELALTGAPSASGSSSLIQVGSAISGGSSAGTYLGINAGSGFTGNLVDLQTNNVSKFSVSNSGVTTTAGALTVSSGGATISAGGLTVSAGNISQSGTGTLSTGTGAISLNGDTTVASGKGLILAGASLPGSGTEGELFFDSTNKQLNVYENGAWQRSTGIATKVIAASNAANKGNADYQASGTNDQTTINAAITALPSTGGVIYLTDGTFSLGAAVTITKSNVSIIGAGSSTIVKRVYDSTSSEDGAITIGDTTGTIYSNISVSYIQIDGNSSVETNTNDDAVLIKDSVNTIVVSSTTIVNTKGIGVSYITSTASHNPNTIKVIGNAISGSQSAINMYGASASAPMNAIISDNTITNSGNWNIQVAKFDNSIIARNNIPLTGSNSGITITSGTGSGIIYGNTMSGGQHGIGGGSNWLIEANLMKGLGGTAIFVASNESVVGNQIVSAGIQGIYINTSSNSSVTGNTINMTANSGKPAILITTGANNTITGNTISIGASTANGVYISGAGNSNIISNNQIYGGGGSGYAIKIDAGTGNYLSNNLYTNTGATSISDAGTGTVYANQLNSSGNLALQSGANSLLLNTATLTSAGALSGLTGLTVASGGLTVTAGGATITAGGLTVTGATTSSTATSAAFTANSATQTAFQATSAPTASNSTSLLQLGSAIAAGSSSGNYIGVNAGNTFTGNFVDFETNNTSQFKVDSTGTVTSLGAVNGISLSSNAITGGAGNFTFTGGTASGNTLTLVSSSNGTKGDIQFFSSSNKITSAGNATFAGTLTVNTTGSVFTGSVSVATLTSAGALSVTTAANGAISLAPNGSGSVTINTSGGGSTKIGDGGTTNYAAFDQNGVLTFSGSARPFSEIDLAPVDAVIPGSGGCTLTTTDDTNMSYKTIDCAHGSSQWANWQFKMPANYVNNSNITVDIYWEDAASASTNNVVWTSGYTSVAANAAWTGATRTDSTNATQASGGQNKVNDTTITLSAPSVLANDMVSWRVTRVGGDAGDTLTDAAKVIQVRIKYQVSS